jgi:threonine/homoserine/homoserine lactone efflux protein
MGIIEQLVGAFAVGFIGGAVPGPILTTAMAESLRKGFSGSLKVVFKAMISETILAVLMLTVFSLFDIPRSFFYAVSLAGAAVLVWFGARMWGIKNIDEGGVVFYFYKIFLLMVCNGLFWLYWLTVCVPLAFLLRQSLPFGHMVFLAFFEFGWLASTVAVVFVFSRFRPFIMEKNLIPAAFKFFSAVFVLFAVRLAAESAVFFAG